MYEETGSLRVKYVIKILAYECIVWSKISKQNIRIKKNFKKQIQNDNFPVDHRQINTNYEKQRESQAYNLVAWFFYVFCLCLW